MKLMQLSYLNVQSNKQSFRTQNNFKGELGKKLVERTVQNGNVPFVKDILPKIKGLFSLNAKKTKDVLESFSNEIGRLLEENKILEKAKSDYQRLFSDEKRYSSELDYKLTLEKNIVKAKDELISEKNKELEAKNARIKELEKYAKLAEIKSVDSLEITMEKVVSVIDEIVENKTKSYESLAKYVFEGNGQEEFLKQIERSSYLNKAKIDGILDNPQLKEKLNNLEKFMAGSPYNTSKMMLTNALRVDSRSDSLHSKSVFSVVENNINALFDPLKGKYDKEETSTILKDIVKYRNTLEMSMDTLNESGWNKIDEKIVAGDPAKSNYTFVRNKQSSDKRCYNFNDLAWGYLGYYTKK